MSGSQEVEAIRTRLEKIDRSPEMAAWRALADELRPYWHQHRLPVCCGRCGRRITTIHRDCGHLLGDPRHCRNNLPPLGGLGRQGYPARRAPVSEHGWEIAPLGDRFPGGAGYRITFTCRCGARATRRMDRLILDFVAARKNGQRKLIVGQGDHEVT